MNKNHYNSKDEEHLHVIKLLKELPKEKAPDNFEYNLSIKIKNKNFGLNTKEPKFLMPWKILLPSTGVALSAILLFFVVFTENDSIENPFLIKPKLRTELSGNLLNSTNKDVDNKNSISENDVIIQENKPALIAQQTPKANKKSVAETEIRKPNFPFNNSTDLDEALSKNSPSAANSRASLAGNSKLESVFNGFYIRNEVDKEYVEA
ncbi:MAG: hypothetical protein OQJ81_08695, partial [Melioribacteraceae bacterium]|nr:hypothetical protein [Melioribacteraceae bacterium]